MEQNHTVWTTFPIHSTGSLPWVTPLPCKGYSTCFLLYLWCCPYQPGFLFCPVPGFSQVRAYVQVLYDLFQGTLGTNRFAKLLLWFPFLSSGWGHICIASWHTLRCHLYPRGLEIRCCFLVPSHAFLAPFICPA